MSNRSQSLRMWERVSAGDLEPDVVEWLRLRAAEIVEADSLPAARRPDAVVRAAGLAYRAEPYAHVRDEVGLMLAFPLLDEHGAEREPARGEETKAMIAAARAAEPGWANLSDDEVRKRLQRLFARKR